MTISEKFVELKQRGEKALVLFVTAGDPSLDDLPAIIDMLQEAGADLIEVGIPFSDPIGDGPVIQASSQRALDRGVTPTQVLETLARAKRNVPIVLMGYTNPALRIGWQKSAEAMARSGANGTILVDLTPEEADEWVAASRAHCLDNIFLTAPTSTDVRLVAACKNASGFVYAVSRTGVTGSASSAPPEVKTLVGRLRTCTNLPICVGFGISKPEHVRMVCDVADGAVLGSWLVNLLALEWNSGRGATVIRERIRELKAATK